MERGLRFATLILIAQSQSVPRETIAMCVRMCAQLGALLDSTEEGCDTDHDAAMHICQLASHPLPAEGEGEAPVHTDTDADADSATVAYADDGAALAAFTRGEAKASRYDWRGASEDFRTVRFPCVRTVYMYGP